MAAQPPSNDFPKYTWRDVYLAAVLEQDNAKLPERIAEAHRAIAERYRILNMDQGGSPEERAEVDAAVHALLILQENVCLRSASLACTPS